jgi:hypothetical protein
LKVLFLFALVILAGVISINDAFAIPTISFNQLNYTLNSFPIKITIDDSFNSEFTDISSGIQKISAILESGAEQKTITLTETGDTTGIFTTSIALSHQDYEFNVGDTIQINLKEEFSNIDKNKSDVTQVHVFTNDFLTLSVKESISEFTLTETGPNTGYFTGTLTLVNDSTGEDKIKADPSDIIVIINQSFQTFYGLVMPNSNDGFNIIKISTTNQDNFLLDTLTVSYQDVSVNVDVLDDVCDPDVSCGGGGGGGGLVNRPGLVLDFLAALLGGSNTSTPPTLGLDENQKRIVDGGFSFNGNPVDVLQYYTPYPLITTPVGQNNTIKLKIYEDSGPDNITHVGLSYGLGKGETFNEGRATIEYDKTFDGIKSVTLFDPKHVLGKVNVTSTITNCSTHNNAQCLEVTFDHMFREPLEYNMVATNIWDFERNGWQNYYNHGIQIVGESMNPLEQYSGIYQGHTYHLTESGKNTAVDDDGNNWTFDKIWNRDYIKPVNVDSNILNQNKIHAIESLGFQYSDGQEIFGFDRVDHRFSDTKNQQQTEAKTIMASLCPECQKEPFEKINDIFAYDMQTRYSKLSDPETVLQMNLEDQKARQFLQAFFEQIYHKSVD